ncbi:uncharacterized protein IL334_004557 [Kwoniella shivajii]|uniref:Protein CPL1-like domain-containing protein n=1 Tax=Kwoniella shivajii TaxID=564305 RepID=A0ABZ1D0M8_9TREE|nr:hypothetical protein IL334_004557 [Kwoniella shivajii]
MVSLTVLSPCIQYTGTRYPSTGDVFLEKQIWALKKCTVLYNLKSERENVDRFPFSGGFNAYSNTNYALTTANCDVSSGYAFGTPPVNPSGTSARRARARALAIKREQENQLCPNGNTACKLPNTNTYECIDIFSELESCGGCVNGLFDDQYQNATIGIDCTAAEGIAMGAVTCTRGLGATFACEDGYVLVGGICVIEHLA